MTFAVSTSWTKSFEQEASDRAHYFLDRGLARRDVAVRLREWAKGRGRRLPEDAIRVAIMTGAEILREERLPHQEFLNG